MKANRKKIGRTMRAHGIVCSIYVCLCAFLLSGPAFACDSCEIANNTEQSLTINESLDLGDYYWWVNCSSAGTYEVSEVRVITIADIQMTVSSPLTYDSSLGASASFTQGQDIRIRVNATDIGGASSLDSAVITLLLKGGTAAVNNASMTPAGSISSGLTYEYNYTIPYGDEYKEIWTVNVYVNNTGGLMLSGSSYFGVDKSEVNNTGTTSILAYLRMVVQKKNEQGAWIDEATIVNDSSPRIITAGSGLALDQVWWNSGAWNTSDNPGGEYRAYAELCDNEGNVLVSDDGGAMNASYPFNLSGSNEAPVVDGVSLSDSDGGNIGLSVADDTIVLCNASVTDVNGYQDIVSADATLYHQTVSSPDPDDYNVHYTNSSCSFTSESGNERNVSCAFTLHHEALNGTWTCNVSASDSIDNSNSSAGDSIVDQLVALSVLEDSVSFGSMSPGQNSSSANGTNITNMGNVMIDIQVAANADMSCSGAGVIGAGNISYGVFPGNYDSMSAKKLSTGYVNESAFDLGVEGIETSEGVASARKEYWAIVIPFGVSGSCNNTVTVLAVLDDGSQITYFYVRNSSGDKVASFSDAGEIRLTGSCIAGGSCSAPPDGTFLVQNSSGATVSYIDEWGNLCIQDTTCSDYDLDCSYPGEGSFVVQNSAGTNMAYIDSAGSLCMRGKLASNTLL
jgi:hypothetical protein